VTLQQLQLGPQVVVAAVQEQCCLRIRSKTYHKQPMQSIAQVVGLNSGSTL
jgi:hypothetical protein